MIVIQYRILATLRVTHAFTGGVYRGIEFVIPAESETVLRRGRMLAKVLDGVLHLLYEADDTNVRRVSAAGAMVRVGLRVADPQFGNITAPSSLPQGGAGWWRNTEHVAQLDAPVTLPLRGSLFEHPLSHVTRPATVRVEDAHGDLLHQEEVTAEQQRTAVWLDLGGAPPGPITLRESYGAVTSEARYLVHPELAREPLLGVVDLEIAESFYTTPPAFEIGFAARQDTLRYYLVLTNLPVTQPPGDFTADLNKLLVEDQGATDDARPKVDFERVAASSFGADELPASLLGGTDTRVVMFRSTAQVARRERARRKLQLRRNGNVVVEHLPQPGAEQPDANFVVHVPKVK